MVPKRNETLDLGGLHLALADVTLTRWSRFGQDYAFWPGAIKTSKHASIVLLSTTALMAGINTADTEGNRILGFANMSELMNPANRPNNLMVTATNFIALDFRILP